MNAPNRSAEIAAWVSKHRVLFTGDADTKTRELLTPLAQHLNVAEGRDVWGVLAKTDRTPPFIPHDILMWKDTREHFDVFTGPDSGKAEDVQAFWGFNAPPDNPRWIWQSVEDDVVEPLVDPPNDDLEIRVATLEGLVGTLEQLLNRQLKTVGFELDEKQHQITALGERIRAVEDAPPPVPDLTGLVVKGNTGRVWGHAHSLELEVVKK